MSRSLAPSPTATVWLTGTPACAANRRSASAFPARSMTGPASCPVSLPAADLQRVGGRVVDAELGGQRVGDLGEAAADDPAAVAEPVQGADQRPGAGREPQLPPDLVEHRRVQARPACATRSGSEAAKSSLAAHGGLGDLGDLLGAARLRGQQVDHLGRDQRGVHVHHDQAHRPAVQPAALDRHVDALLGRLPGQGHPQRVRIGAGHVEVDAGHRPVREPVDAVDVRAVGRDPAGDGRDRRRGQRAAQDGDVQLAAAPGGSPEPMVISASSPRSAARARIARWIAVRSGSGRAAEQGAEHQPAPDHHLLDVQHAELRGRPARRTGVRSPRAGRGRSG